MAVLRTVGIVELHFNSIFGYDLKIVECLAFFFAAKTLSITDEEFVDR